MYQEYIGEWVSVETSNTDRPVEGLLERYDEATRTIHMSNGCPDCDHFIAIKEQYVVAVVRYKSKLPPKLSEKGNQYGN